VGVQLGVGGGT